MNDEDKAIFERLKARRRKLVEERDRPDWLERISAPVGMLRIFDDDGLITESDNLVVVGYRFAMVYLLSGNNIYRIDKLIVSNGGTTPDFLNSVMEGLPADQTTISRPAMVYFTDYDFTLADNTGYPWCLDTVRFRWTMAATEGNGLTYTEAGLFCSGDDGDTTDPLHPRPGRKDIMFAHVVFDPIIKGPSRTLRFEWIISFN
jgi:hypothetical protein